MRVQSWTRLSWWQKTRSTAILFSVLALGFAFIFIVALAGLSNSKAINLLSWTALSMYPLFIVVLITLFVRAQRRINMKAPSAHRKTNRNG